MPVFRVPITWKAIDPDPTGPIRRVLRAVVKAEVQDRHGGWVRLDPVIDTGASTTTVSATWARANDIEVPAATSRLTVRTAAGVMPSEVHDGELRLRFPQLPGREFRLFCLFSEQVPPATPPVLGLNDTLDAFRLTFDGASRPDAPAGVIVFEAV